MCKGLEYTLCYSLSEAFFFLVLVPHRQKKDQSFFSLYAEEKKRHDFTDNGARAIPLFVREREREIFESR
jgi:hypothetical protein